VKPTNSGLLLHYESHVHDRYKRGLLKTMLDRAFRLSSNWSCFSEEFNRLKVLLSRLKYPNKLINSTITRFIALKASDQPVPPPVDTYETDSVRAVLPLKDQAPADILGGQLRSTQRPESEVLYNYPAATRSNKILNCARLSHRL